MTKWPNDKIIINNDGKNGCKAMGSYKKVQVNRKKAK